VVLDLAMPGMSGLELFKYMKEIYPGVRVLLTSGLMESEDVRTAMALGVRGFLQKPYSVEELSLKIKEVLG
jgi:YesN/AraC family two-component response regulator